MEVQFHLHSKAEVGRPETDVRGWPQLELKACQCYREVFFCICESRPQRNPRLRFWRLIVKERKQICIILKVREIFGMMLCCSHCLSTSVSPSLAVKVTAKNGSSLNNEKPIEAGFLMNFICAAQPYVCLLKCERTDIGGRTELLFAWESDNNKFGRSLISSTGEKR